MTTGNYIDMTAVKAELLRAYKRFKWGLFFRSRKLQRLDAAIKNASAYIHHGYISEFDKQYLSAWMFIAEYHRNRYLKRLKGRS
jgi:hypothetical protein